MMLSFMMSYPLGDTFCVSKMGGAGGGGNSMAVSELGPKKPSVVASEPFHLYIRKWT